MDVHSNILSPWFYGSLTLFSSNMIFFTATVQLFTISFFCFPYRLLKLCLETWKLEILSLSIQTFISFIKKKGLSSLFSSMAKTPVLVELFYDIVSPYSFLAFEVLQRYKNIWRIDLQLKPMLLAGVMKGSGNKPPAVVPNKGVYMATDLKRLQKYFQVPLFLPSNLMDIIFKHGTLNVMRFVTAVDIANTAYLESITRALWLRLYKDHTDIQELQDFREAGISIKMDPEVLKKALNSMNSPEVKERLKKYTDEALNLGAFGAPMIVAHINGTPEVFFGSDRFELLASLLGEKWLGPVPYSVPASKI